MSLLNQGLMAKGLTSQNKAIEWIAKQLAAGFFPPGNDPVAEYWLACLEELGINETVHAQLLAAAAVNTIFRISPSESRVSHDS